ncbi:ribosomal protein S18 acetylase RimI-like enzyme [Microbacterium endophyticum]|uniref:Ribosomal protein S18 acetylase RimI-like enzyme n=1 Tax=Microbacterium endophyticum TaxID=1526412 RepID=A0A7W4V0U1_9MICO|nr:GNAT family N-acetyltransferase [Microbacterium endophyticum]MBB2974669.1 ribosomal protein S18 acetylase RimI-like enzyme [Microbacterium endophyticum]NIK36966.1 ribosomal protein S18 acetylase RimI-like enzyme [Microbacterium endophyticum]
MFTISPASPSDVSVVSRMLAATFSDETVMSTLIHGSHRQERFTELFAAILRSSALRTGRVDLARRQSDGMVLGAAIWEHPSQRASILAHLRELPTFVGALGWRGLRGAIQLKTTLARHRPAEPHWYLSQIGVSVEARGAGVGAALLESRLKSIDADAAPAYLESSNERNRSLYRRHGFEAVSLISGIKNAHPMAMWRPSHRKEKTEL